MSKVIEYPKEVAPLTPEQKVEARRIIAQAKAAGHPLARYAGLSMDDPSFFEFLDIMRENRRRADENPEQFGVLDD